VEQSRLLKIRGGTLGFYGYAPRGHTNLFLGTGRRKESVARVFLRPGSGKFKNQRPHG